MSLSAALPARQRVSRVLVTSPNKEFRLKVSEHLASDSLLIEHATGGADTLATLETLSCSKVLLDRRLTDLQAEEVAEILRQRQPGVQVVLVDSEEDPVEAADCLTSASLPTSTIQTDPSVWQTMPRNKHPRTWKPSAFADTNRSEVAPLAGMQGTHPSMNQVFRMARLVAPRGTTVLITGETGTGKELVARGIHQLSERRNGPFVVVNCAAIPEPLLEAELFGHTRGAFTGAIQSRLGRIHAAHGGTLFLDEAGDLPLAMQAKLLRFLQDGEVQRLGSPDVFRVDVRVIAATNADLKQRIAEKLFRRDLYYRLAVFPIHLPNLAMRQDDILPLAVGFLEKLSRVEGLPPKRFTPCAAALLQRHTWPGNVRELEHIIERAFILADGREELSAELFHFEGTELQV
jgi:DNA-binding NtrC family response regulator